MISLLIEKQIDVWTTIWYLTENLKSYHGPNKTFAVVKALGVMLILV